MGIGVGWNCAVRHLNQTELDNQFPPVSNDID
jgi:hypothetical protein